MAKSQGMSQSAVSRIWRAFGLKPHLAETWKLTTDPRFIDKVRDVAGLYMCPPENALVLCVDEKSQIQALDRTAPCLPTLPTTPARMTHDYVRNGTTSLFAAFDLASGSVIAQPYRRHRHQEFLRFLKLIDAAVPRDLELHLVLDDYATHKTPAIHQWLLNTWFHLHFTPTSSSWMNLVERWLAKLTNRKLRRSAHRSVTRLELDIRKWISGWNETPGRSSGPRPPMRSWRPSPPTAAGSAPRNAGRAAGRVRPEREYPLLPVDPEAEPLQDRRGRRLGMDQREGRSPGRRMSRPGADQGPVDPPAPERGNHGGSPQPGNRARERISAGACRSLVPVPHETARRPAGESPVDISVRRRRIPPGGTAGSLIAGDVFPGADRPRGDVPGQRPLRDRTVKGVRADVDRAVHARPQVQQRLAGAFRRVRGPPSRRPQPHAGPAARPAPGRPAPPQSSPRARPALPLPPRRRRRIPATPGPREQNPAGTSGRPKPQTPAAPHALTSSSGPPGTRRSNSQLQRHQARTQHPESLTANAELTTQDTRGAIL